MEDEFHFRDRFGDRWRAQLNDARARTRAVRAACNSSAPNRLLFFAFDSSAHSRHMKSALLAIYDRLTRSESCYTSRTLDSGAGIDQRLGEVLRNAVASGSLTFTRLSTPKWTPANADQELSSLPAAPSLLSDGVGFLEVHVVNTHGYNVPGIACEIAFEDGSARRGRTDTDGTLRITSLAPTGKITVRLLNIIPFPASEARGSPAGRLRIVEPGVVANINARTIIEIPPQVVTIRLIGAYFDTNKCFVLPSARPAIIALVATQRELGMTHAFVVGHTAPSGPSFDNDRLSQERARAFGDLLLGDVDGWCARYADTIVREERWGTKEDLTMIDALPNSAHRAEGESAIAWFQRVQGLPIDGVAREATRRVLISMYMALYMMDATRLMEDTELTIHGCGASFPGHSVAKGVVQQDCQRVEIFLFASVSDLQPAPRGETSHSVSADYPAWAKLSIRTQDFRANACSVAIRIVDGLGKPLAHAPYKLTAGSQSRVSRTDDDGLLHEEQISPGSRCVLRWALPPRPGAPAPCPPIYDFEREIAIHYATRERDESAMARLHNLGYEGETLLDNVARFQRDFGIARAKWFDEVTWNQLVRIHDEL